MAFKIVTAPHRILIKDIETGKVIFDEVIPETFGEKAVHLTGIALNAIEKIEENSREESAASITITNDTWALCEFFFILGRICGKKNSKRLFKPNLQKVKMKVGSTRVSTLVCTACIRSGKVAK